MKLLPIFIRVPNLLAAIMETLFVLPGVPLGIPSLAFLETVSDQQLTPPMPMLVLVFAIILLLVYIQTNIGNGSRG